MGGTLSQKPRGAQWEEGRFTLQQAPPDSGLRKGCELKDLLPPDVAGHGGDTQPSGLASEAVSMQALWRHRGVRWTRVPGLLWVTLPQALTAVTRVGVQERLLARISPEPSRVRQPSHAVPPRTPQAKPHSSGLRAAQCSRARPQLGPLPLLLHSLLRPFPESERVPKTSGGKLGLLGSVLRKVPESLVPLRPGLAPSSRPSLSPLLQEESPKPSRDAPPACLTVVPADGAFQH